jgi:hypothetical protein
MANTFMVFDVESVGLHGEGFAVGWVVVEDGKVIASAEYACDPKEATGTDSSRDWISKNVPRPIVGYNCRTPRQVRSEFWRAWDYARRKGATLVAECAWPVEARFLAQCVDDLPAEREFTGPYPLHELATLLLLKGINPLEKIPRLPDELPEHDPLNDARQSARLLVENLK